MLIIHACICTTKLSPLNEVGGLNDETPLDKGWIPVVAEIL